MRRDLDRLRAGALLAASSRRWRLDTVHHRRAFHTVSFAFHTLSAILAAAAILVSRRRASLPGMLLAVLGQVAVSFVFASVIGGGAFLTMRCCAWTGFFYVPRMLAALAMLDARGHRRRAALFAAVALAIALVGCDAFFVEPHSLTLSHPVVRTSKVDRPLRIGVISDIQMDSFGDYERGALHRLMEEKPDLILFPGDFIQVRTAEEYASIASAFRQALATESVDAPLGMFATQGNMEGRGWEHLWDGTKVRPLAPGERVEADRFVLDGLDLAQSFDPHMDVPETRAFHIVMGHAPDFSLGPIHADLLVAGHTHGGQVRLPFIGPLVTYSAVPRAWAAGMTRLSGGRTLVVSRGVGMERGDAPRLRFLCKPEIVVIDVQPN